MKNIVITISDSYLYSLSSIAEIFRKEGLIITNLYEFGVITGNAEDKTIRKLYKHKEIISLTEDNQVNIAPPDSLIQ
jgi:hypothetical protein